MYLFMVIVAVILVLSGLFCMFFSSFFMQILGIVVALAILMGGVSTIILFWRYRLSFWILGEGIFSSVLALCILFINSSIDHLIPYILSFWLVLKGIMYIFIATKMRAANINSGLNSVVFGGIFIALGIVFFLNPEILASFIGIVIGVVAILLGVGAFMFAKSFKKMKI